MRLRNALLGGIGCLLVLTATRCQTPLRPPSGVVALSGGWKRVVYLLQPRQLGEIAMNYGGVVADSAVIGADGRFVFSRVQLPAEPALYEICLQREGSGYPNKREDENPLLANYMPVVLQAGKPFFCTAEAERFQASFSLENPSADNRALLQLRDLRHGAFLRDSALLGPQGGPDEDNLLEYEAAQQRWRQPLMAFADTSASFWASLAAVRWVSPSGDYERTPELVVQWCEKRAPLRPGDPWAAQVCAIANRERLPVLVGDRVPDYPLPMAGGDTLPVRRMLGTKLTVLDIWAAWCLPCRVENRETLAPLWRQYRDKGLQIVGYSIDRNAASWSGAISKDGASWPQASHLTGDSTPFLDALRIRTIPSNLILDAQGTIIAKNIHGEALQAFVENYFMGKN